MEYQIVEAKDNAANLQEAVNQLIQEGWEPLGGIAVFCSHQSFVWWYYQAMIKNPRR